MSPVTSPFETIDTMRRSSVAVTKVSEHFSWFAFCDDDPLLLIAINEIARGVLDREALSSRAFARDDAAFSAAAATSHLHSGSTSILPLLANARWKQGSWDFQSHKRIVATAASRED